MLAIAGLLVGLLSCEGLVRVLGLEDRVVIGALFWLDGGYSVGDPFLHYRPLGPRPGAKRPEPASPATRISCFGGSTTWGIGVSDDETLPARLEAWLDARRRPGALPFVVANYGVPGYTLAQAAHLAREQLAAATQPPDLMLVQLHNRGRRPFQGVPGKTRSYPREHPGVDVDFFLEQFPVPGWLSLAAHRTALGHSALYRACVAASTHLYRNRNVHCARCDELDAREAQALGTDANARGVPILYIAIPEERGQPPQPGVPLEQLIDLYRPGREPEFYEVHPPAYVLDEWAGTIATEILTRDVLATRGRRNVSP